MNPIKDTIEGAGDLAKDVADLASEIVVEAAESVDPIVEAAADVWGSLWDW